MLHERHAIVDGRSGLGAPPTELHHVRRWSRPKATTPRRGARRCRAHRGTIGGLPRKRLRSAVGGFGGRRSDRPGPQSSRSRARWGSPAGWARGRAARPPSVRPSAWSSGTSLRASRSSASKPRGDAAQLSCGPPELAHRIGELVRTEDEQRHDGDDKQLGGGDVEHGRSLRRSPSGQIAARGRKVRRDRHPRRRRQGAGTSRPGEAARGTRAGHRG